jgi:hypothetical protein
MWQSTGEAMRSRSLPDEVASGYANPRVDSIPVESIYGIGKRYSEALRGIGVETVGEVARITDLDEFDDLLGIPAKVLHRIRLRALSYASGEVLQTESFEFPGGRLVYIDVETDPAACATGKFVSTVPSSLSAGRLVSPRCKLSPSAPQRLGRAVPLAEWLQRFAGWLQRFVWHAVAGSAGVSVGLQPLL